MNKSYIKFEIPEIRVIDRKEDGNIIAGKVINQNNGQSFKIPSATLTMRYTYLDRHSDKIAVFDEDVTFDIDSDNADEVSEYTFYKNHNLSEDVTGILIEAYDPRNSKQPLTANLIFVYEHAVYEKILTALNEIEIFKIVDKGNADCFSVFVLLCSMFGWFNPEKVMDMIDRELKGEKVKSPSDPMEHIAIRYPNNAKRYERRSEE